MDLNLKKKRKKSVNSRAGRVYGHWSLASWQTFVVKHTRKTTKQQKATTNFSKLNFFSRCVLH